MQKHQIPENEIDMVHGFVPGSVLSIKPDNAGQIRKLLDIPETAFIVGGSGMTTWAKGKTLFVQLAFDVIRRLQDRCVHFVWVGGGGRNGIDYYQIQHDINHAGLSERVHIIPHVSNPIDYYADFNVFAMISREDSYPLVNLEVAALGKPIICFDKAGGTPEFVEDDAGFVVPYLDIHAMADKVIILANDDGLRKKLGCRASEKVREKNDIEVCAPKILDIIDRFI
ncbi:glycosyltransferase family 4 protein [Candidatus Scalindua japonica]|uniref:glycosyltransferase family 4 protein n=1 Tax=Candidatus Scalindua japonica TaxID=1284222 RepID=UPI001054C32E|nr:glycosyltransferase family 4 protein [Candidatus Scalindua japonica]